MNSKQNRNRFIVVAVICGLALAGLFFVNTDRVAAVKASPSVENTQLTDGESENIPVTSQISRSYVPSLVKMISALVVVIICVYFALYLLRRLMGKRYSGNRTNNVMEILETTYIAPKKTVSLIRVADKAVLVGISEAGISTLTEFGPDDTAAIMTKVNVERKENENFKRVFESATRKIKAFGLRKDRTALET